MPNDSGLTGLTFKRPSLVKVQFADECDISLIVKRFVRTGELPSLAVKSPLKIADASMLPEDFQALQEQHVAAVRLFESEPLELQEFFNHDVVKYFDWRALSDDAKVDFLKENGSPALCKQLIKGYVNPPPVKENSENVEPPEEISQDPPTA